MQKFQLVDWSIGRKFAEYDQRLIAKKLVMNFLTIPSKPFALVFDFSA